MQKKSMIVLILALISLGIITFKIILIFQKETPKTKVTGKADVLVRSLIISPTITPTPTLTPVPTRIPTQTIVPTPTLIPVIVAPKDLDNLFIKYGNEYSVDKELLKRIANCESSLDPNASTSLYAGLFQFGETIWIQMRNLLGLDSNVNLRFSPEESIKTAAFMVSQGHLGIWPNCGK